MEGRRSFVSSRSFANDRRPVPNIVAIFERPRHKIRRDATHVLGGMFGWNNPEETERALRTESSREEEAATPDSATPIDAGLARPSQRCVKKPAKRAKRRGFAPLVDMGTSILSLHFQELLRRQHQPEEPEDLTPVSVPAKRPIEPATDIPTPSTVTASASKKIKILGSTGDAPIAKKLRLTITAPPTDVSLSTTLPTSFLQMPLSPPDTSSNASKAPVEEPTLGFDSTANDPFLLPGFDVTLSPDLIDSESESESSSESSSDLDSDSPDLSSSTSTPSAAQDKGKGKFSASQRATTAQKVPIARKTISASPAPLPDPDSPVRGPSTPPRKKRPVHKPGWIGWVQTEESPDHSRLIRLDDAPVILGRRTRSGKEFQDPPPPPPSRRRPANAGQPKPAQPARPRPKPTRKGKKSEAPTGEKSKQQTAWQEAQKRAADGVADEVQGDATFVVGEDEVEGDIPNEGVTEGIANGEGVFARTDDANASPLPKDIQPDSSPSIPLASKIPPPALSAPVLKLTHSDAVIVPTAGRPDGTSEKENNKRDVSENNKDALENNNKDAPENNNKGVPTTQKHRASTKASSIKSRVNATDQRDDLSRTSPTKLVLTLSKDSAASTLRDAINLSKANDATASKKSLLKNDQTNQVYVALQKSKPSTSSSSKPLASSRAESSRRQSGWGSDSSAGEVSPNALHIPRVGSPSPPERVKRLVQKFSSNSAQSGSGTKAPETTSAKSGDTPASASSIKPATASDRQLYNSRFGKTIHVTAGPTLGKRKEHVVQASSAHFKKRKLSRKLVLESSESETPRPTGFTINPFERRAKQMELTRKGVSGESFRHEMEKWVEMKRAEWRKSKGKGKGKSGDSGKSGSDGKVVGNASEPSKPVESGSGAVADNPAPKPSKDLSKGSKEITTAPRDALRINELPRIPKTTKEASQSDHAGNSPKIHKPARLVWNGDWGMDVHQVSISGTGDPKSKFKRFPHRREPDGTTTDRRDGDSSGRRIKDHPSNQHSTNPVPRWGTRV